MKKQFISELKVGTPVDTIFAVEKKQIRKKKNGQDYCTISLKDRDGSIEGVLWTEVFCSAPEFNEGDFVRIKGEVSEFRDLKQLIITSLENVVKKEEIKYEDFIKSSQKDTEEMFSQIKYFINSIENPFLATLFDLFLEDKKFVENFKTSTAAVKYHHAYRSGLLEHTLYVTRICEVLADVYSNINRDLLISGAILHDVGKISEYQTGINIKITDEGRLLGHITIGYAAVLEKIKSIKGFPEDLADRLLHIIVSHHGHKEFGSPKRPKILEAFIVYHVDHMDADIGGFNQIIEENKDENDWSDYTRNFERPVFLKKLESPAGLKNREERYEINPRSKRENDQESNSEILVETNCENENLRKNKNSGGKPADPTAEKDGLQEELF